MKYLPWFTGILLIFVQPLYTRECGIESGTLIISGGGGTTDNQDILQALIDNMGGLNEPLVYIPTATSDPDPDEDYIEEWNDRGFTDVSVLHTRDPDEADSEDFVGPLLRARAVYMGGGRQWRLADSYYDTRTLTELDNVLKRGGVIIGSSAGATIQGSFLPRGDVDGSSIMISDVPEDRIGFGFLPNVAFDVHVAERERETHLYEVLEFDTTLLGIGINERTAILVQNDVFKVIGETQVQIHTWENVKGCTEDDVCYSLLDAGDWYDLCNREETSEPVSLVQASAFKDEPFVYAGTEKGVLTLSMEFQNYSGTVTMYAITGARVFQKGFDFTNKLNFDPGVVLDGIYLVELKTSDKLYRQKVYLR